MANPLAMTAILKKHVQKPNPRTLSTKQSMRSTPINDLIEVRSSPLGGVGIYARKAIPSSIMLLKEEPVLIATEDHEVHALYEALCPQQKQEFNQLHWWWERSTDPILGRFKTNEFGIQAKEDGKARFGVVGLVISRFNHDCEPSAKVAWEVERSGCRRGYVRVDATREIRKGEEIKICYRWDAEQLYKYYGFDCRCRRCKVEVEKKWSRF